MEEEVASGIVGGVFIPPRGVQGRWVVQEGWLRAVVFCVVVLLAWKPQPQVGPHFVASPAVLTSKRKEVGSARRPDSEKRRRRDKPVRHRTAAWALPPSMQLSNLSWGRQDKACCCLSNTWAFLVASQAFLMSKRKVAWTNRRCDTDENCRAAFNLSFEEHVLLSQQHFSPDCTEERQPTQGRLL